MKKIICGFAAAVICISTALGVSAEGESAKIKLGVANKITDNGYEVTVRMLSDFDCAGVQGSLMYLGMDYTGVELPEAVAAKNSVADSVETSAFGVKFSLLGDVKNGINGKLGEFNFTANSAANAGTVQAGVTAVSLNNNSPKKITECETFMYGDAHQDNTIDIRDLVNIKKRIAANDYADAADCNADGLINSDDLVPLRQYLMETVGATLG